MNTRNPDREVKMIPAICTQCGGQMEVASTDRKAVCRFCGTTFFVTQREDISESEERAKRRRIIWGKNRNRVIWLDITFCLIAMCIAMFILNTRGGFGGSSSAKTIAVEYSSAQYNKDKNYQDTINKLSQQGFENIEVRKSRDLPEGSTIHDGHVDYISIQGETEFEAGTKFPQDAAIIIYYYSYE